MTVSHTAKTYSNRWNKRKTHCYRVRGLQHDGAWCSEGLFPRSVDRVSVLGFRVWGSFDNQTHTDCLE